MRAAAKIGDIPPHSSGSRAGVRHLWSSKADLAIARHIRTSSDPRYRARLSDQVACAAAPASALENRAY
jgi:hypothetical protein